MVFFWGEWFLWFIVETEEQPSTLWVKHFSTRLTVGLAEGGKAGHPVQDRELATGVVAVDALQQPEDEVADGEKALSVVVLVVRVHHDERGGLRAREMGRG